MTIIQPNKENTQPQYINKKVLNYHEQFLEHFINIINMKV
jgi:hypothetical protein